MVFNPLNNRQSSADKRHADGNSPESDAEPFVAAELPKDPRFKEGADKINRTGIYGGAEGKALVWAMRLVIAVGILILAATLIHFIF